MSSPFASREESKEQHRNIIVCGYWDLKGAHLKWFQHYYIIIDVRDHLQQGRIQDFFQEGVHSSLALLQHQ